MGGSSPKLKLALAGACLAACLGASSLVISAETTKAFSMPDFGSAGYGWFEVGDDFLPPHSGPGPVTFDPKHPYFSNQSGKQPTYRVADLTNPILKLWVSEKLRAANEIVLAGKIPYNPRALLACRCSRVRSLYARAAGLFHPAARQGADRQRGQRRGSAGLSRRAAS